jgi:hypothetical protein
MESSRKLTEETKAKIGAANRGKKREDACVLYYTSNRERPEFEAKVQRTILENCGGLPIVSVSQKPIDFGTNIVVGDVGTSGFNMIRQIAIGCEIAKTRFIISAEADCLYPPDYFRFRPERDDVCYRNTNTCIVGHRRDVFWRKHEGGTWAQVVNRTFYLERMNFLLDGEPWWDANRKNFPKEKGLKFFDSFETFTTEFACISFKSGNGMRHYSHSERVDIPELPYWGSGKELRAKYL